MFATPTFVHRESVFVWSIFDWEVPCRVRGSG